VGIPITGVVENNSYFVCDSCDKRHELLGRGGGQKVADMAGAPLLAQLPMDPSVQTWGDAGTPVVQAAPESPIGIAFLTLVDRVVEALGNANENSGADPLNIDRSGGINRHLPISRD
jgi:ATP-binding protein involved in chromosome partitioning